MKGIQWGNVEIPRNRTINTVIIVASGKSLEGFNFEKIRNLKDTFIIAVNGAGDSVPFADAWFTLDPWGLNGPQLPKNFEGKLYAAVPEDFATPEARTTQHRIIPKAGITFLHRLRRDNFAKNQGEITYKRGLSDDTSCINTGNSGYGALNFAYHLNPKKIILLGVDAGNGYFYSKTKTNRSLVFLPDLFASAVPQLNSKNIKVLNASQNSRVTCFEKINLNVCFDEYEKITSIPQTSKSIIVTMNHPSDKPELRFIKNYKNVCVVGNKNLDYINFIRYNKINEVKVTQNFDLLIINTDNTSECASCSNRLFSMEKADILFHEYDETYKTTLSKIFRQFELQNQEFVSFNKKYRIGNKHILMKYSKTGKDVELYNEPVTIFLILRNGGDTYDYRYVNATAKSLKDNITVPHEIVCITDNASNIDLSIVDRTIAFKHTWPKWWGKIEMFRPALTNNKHALYVDLDTVVTNNIDELCMLKGEFLGIRDFNHPSVLQTGILKWNVDVGYTIYNEFMKNPDMYMTNNPQGDHAFIGTIMKDNHDFLQDYFKNKILSYKKDSHILKSGKSKEFIICFHGKPRPHTVQDKFITTKWSYK